MNFNRIKKNYDAQLWSIDMVRRAVKDGIITEDEFYVITKTPYKEEKDV